MKKLLTEWRKYLKEEESLDPELYGNCGTLAVALLQEAINRGIKGTEVVLVVDADPELDSGDPSEEFDIYHTYSQLEADGSNVYMANLTDMRISYQFNMHPVF